MGPGQPGSETKRTPEKRIAFLAVLAETGNVTMAMRGAGLSRAGAYTWREADPDFAKAWAEALELGVEALEDEANRRAFHGVDKPVFYQGMPSGHHVDANGNPVEMIDGKWCGANREPLPEGAVVTWKQYGVREYSDTLAIFLLKAHKPEKYRERHEHTGPNGGPIQFEKIERRIVDPASPAK